MANLETLELTISASSQSASEGIGSLIHSLSDLRVEVGKNIRGLVRINEELNKLKQVGRMKLPIFGGTSTRTSKTTSAVTGNVARFPTAEEIRKSREAWEAQARANAPSAIPQQARQAQTDWFRNRTQLRIAENEQRRLQLAADKTAPSVKNTAVAIKETARAAEESKPKVSGFSKLLEQVGRIAKTLLIRTALRSLIKSFSETWTAAYNYSKHMGGEFAENVEKARGAIASVSTNIVTTFAPALNMLMPIIQTITTGINYLCTLLQKLFSLLGMGSDLFGVTASQIDKYSDSAGKGGKTTKNLLASFDELNVIQSTGSGSGSGGGGKNFFADMVSNSMAQVNMIVAESMMGIGLILACTGHIGVGVAMMAIGAASFAKTMLEDWKKLPNRVRKTIAEITIVSGIGMLAIGVMALCAGHIPLGIGMLAIGATSIGVTMFAANGDDIGKEVKNTITDIMAIAGVSLMAVGLIVAIAGNIPLGLGLIAAGAASYGAAAAYNPEGLLNSINGMLDQIGRFFTGLWEDIKGVWLTAATWFDDNVWIPISTAATSAWESVSAWWGENISEPISKAWESVSEFFKDLFGSTEVPGSIASYANDAWCEICKWWEENIVGNVTAAWEGVTTFFNNLIGDSESGIIGFFSALWAEISQLWGDIVGHVQEAWGTIGQWFYDNVTKPVGNFFIDCINGIIDAINWIVKQLNSINVTIPGVNGLWNETRIGFNIKEIQKIQRIGEYADGGYGIPKGQLFIANEQGAELVGSMNGQTTVANQNQIIDGIQAGVRGANEAQNALLREQNELLRRMLEKEWEINPTPSAAWGKFNQKSNEMWNMATGR